MSKFYVKVHYIIYKIKKKKKKYKKKKKKFKNVYIIKKNF